MKREGSIPLISMQTSTCKLEPFIGNALQKIDSSPEPAPARIIPALHNEERDAQAYPLRLADGLYFSEVIGPSNDAASQYRRLIRASIDTLRSRFDDEGSISFQDLLNAGKVLQEIDAEFAEKLIDVTLDPPHSLAGPDRTHPYAKLTLARTTLPIRLPSGTRNMLFEKFLVCYSYLDEQGHIERTITPIHSHPLNFETVYFVDADDDSRVVEQEFFLDYNGEPLLQTDGSLQPQFLEDAAERRVKLTLRPGPANEFDASQRVRKLTPFESELSFVRSPELLHAFDGYFRPHRVSVRGAKTRYFALDNYFSLTGRVILYEGASEFVWSHDAWVPR